jgi:hypothetical protein
MPPIIDWCHEAYSGHDSHPAGRPPRPPSDGATVQRRVRAVALMKMFVPADRLRLVERHCPNPYDLSLSKRTWETQCNEYRQRCRVSLPALAFLEFGIAYEEEPALFYLESLCCEHRPAAIAQSFLESLD